MTETTLEDGEILYVASEMIGLALELLDRRIDLVATTQTLQLLAEAKALLKVYSMAIANPPALPGLHAREGEEHPF